LLVELPILNVPQSAKSTRDMILSRQNGDFNTTTQLVEEIIEALGNQCLPWLNPDPNVMVLESGIQDFDITELEWFSSLTRNSKAILATRISSQFIQMKAWDGPGYLRQLQVVIRILSYIQEFRRLYEVLLTAIENNFREDTLAMLITAVATWHPPFEGMGLLPSVITGVVSQVIYPSPLLMIVEINVLEEQAKFPMYCCLEPFACSSVFLTSSPRSTP